MPAWFVGAKTVEVAYQAGDAMKKVPAECDDFGKDAWIAFLKSEGRWSDEFCAALPSKGIFFDGGGCVGTKEATVQWVANGCPMETYVRHLPFAIDALRHLKLRDERLPGCLGFGGFIRVYIISEKTRDAALVEMERLLEETDARRKEIEEAMQRDMNVTPNLASVRKCGCLSGLQYVECCGKGNESESHRKARRAIAAPPKN